MKCSVALLAAVLLALVAPPLHASDHLDGPATSKDRVTDLTDLYAFPTPQTPGFLTIVLDMYPVVAATGHFSDKVSYTIHVRRAALRSGARPGFDTSDDVAIRCTFVTPQDDAAHTATCKTDGGIGATVKTNQALPLGSGDGFHLFAGHRADPFFFNPVFAAAFSMQGKLVTPRDQDIMKGTNALAVVIDVEVKKLFPSNPPSLLALAAETTTQDSPDAPVRRLDRIGRPEITNIALVAHDKEADLRDQYNTDPAFAVPADHASLYRERIAQNLAFFDRIDERADWTDEARLSLADLLTDDFLVVDVALPCDQPAYFEIERSLLTRSQHETCGGRKPAEDVMDVLYGLYAGGLGGKPIGDGVDRPSQPVSGQFPYLAAPDVSPQAAVKTAVLGNSGCKCRTGSGGETGGEAALLALAAGVAMRARRRRRRGRSSIEKTRARDLRPGARAPGIFPGRAHRLWPMKGNHR
jgi:MYXO-CTERM domain-containing protein